MISVDFWYGTSDIEVIQLQATETKVLRLNDRGKALNLYVENKEQAREVFTEVAKMLALFEGDN